MINKRELLGRKAKISYLQISLLILSSFAFSYLMYMSTNPAEKTELEKAFSWFMEKITQPMIAKVSASSFNCCPVNKLGSACNDYVDSECNDRCSTACLPTKCEDSVSCKLGCCFDSARGSCDANSPKATCDARGGVWKDSASCSVNSVPECKFGCCIIGNEAQFVTSRMCENLSTGAGSVDFRAGITTEVGCIALSLADERGACLFSDNGCKMLSNQECRAQTGRNIIKDKLCTSASLNATCTKTQETACIEGKDEVYFVDSCGNTANIYDSSKANSQDYWERVISSSESCNSGNSNAGSKTCGNCDYFSGSRCKDYREAKTEKPNYGNFVCRDMSCKNAPEVIDAFGQVTKRNDRKNGESWCVYDGKIGGGNDIPGSRHFRYSCINGEVKTEPCADFRNEICVQESINDFSTAACRINKWQECIETNTKKNQKCNGLDCFDMKVNPDKDFTFNVCVPKYPPGFELKSEDGQDIAKNLCGLANQQCTVLYEKKITGWKCIANCNCEKAVFTQKMNDFCRSLGDCGGEVNIAGEYSENYKVTNAPRLTGNLLTALKNLAKPLAGQRAEPGNFSQLVGEYLQATGQPSGGGGSAGLAKSMAALSLGSAAIGYAASLAAPAAATVSFEIVTLTESTAWGHIGAETVEIPLSALPSGATSGVVPISASTSTTSGSLGPASAGQVASSGGGTTAGSAAGSTLAGIANFMVGFGAGMLAASIISMAFGLKGDAAMIMMGVGIAVGIAVGVSVMTSAAVASAGAVGIKALIVWCVANPPLCIGAVIVIIAIATILKFLGIGKTKKVYVTFKCMPWQPPAGGANCGKCNNDEKPCSKYRCESLGQACQFVNEGSEKEMCISARDDGKAPAITPWNEIIELTGNFTYVNVSERGFQIREKDGSCIQAFTPLIFGIKTDEAAQCKYDIASKTNYEGMEEFFGGSNFYSFNHSQTFSLPSVDSLLAGINDTNGSLSTALNRIGNLRFYTRCQDYFGNYNPSEYVIDICVRKGPDRTPPMIASITPASGTYLAMNVTSQEVRLGLSEPADCKYSNQDKNYTLMENSMQCIRSVLEAGAYWGECNFTFNNFTRGNNKIYIRCKDQPWFEGTANESNRNVNSQSQEYNLIMTETPLSITRITPNGTQIFGANPIQINLEAGTAGGAENGKATCYYSWAGSWILFFETFSSSHRQRGLNLFSGNWNIPIKCEDIAGNVVLGSAAFNLEVDERAPVVTRLYNEGGSLVVLTDEDSECSYSNSRCNFIFSNGTQMMGGFTRSHSTSFDSGQTYYIKCRDVWNNEASSCSIKARASNVILT